MLALATFAILATFSAFAFLTITRQNQAEAKPIIKVTAEDDRIMVPVPARNIARGERIRDVQFTQVKWPKSQVSSEYVLDLTNKQDAVAVIALPKLLPITESALSTARLDSNAVVDGIPEGMRAITVKVDVESSVEGWARSGNYVDVIVIRNSSDATAGLEAKVIAERVKILSAGRSTSQVENATTAPQAPATVTLLVNQEDALKIKTAANIGKLTFSLRGASDQAPTLAVSMNQYRLIGSSKAVENNKPAAIKGTAQGPDGKRYVLTDKSKWLRDGEPEQPTVKD